MSKREVLGNNSDTSRKIWHEDVYGIYRIPFHCPPGMTWLGAVELLMFHSFQEIKLFGSVTLEEDTCCPVPYLVLILLLLFCTLLSGRLQCSDFSFFAFLFFSSFSGASLNPVGLLELKKHWLLCVQINQKSENLNKFYKSEDILCCMLFCISRIKMNLLYLDANKQSILRDYMYN